MLLPLLLSLLPVLLLWWQASEEDLHRQEARRKRWLERSRNLGRHLQEQVVPGFWPEELARRLRLQVRRLQRLEPGDDFPSLLGKACLELDSPSSALHLRGLRPARLWGVRFNPDGKPLLARHPRLETTYASLISGIFTGRERHFTTVGTAARLLPSSSQAELSALRLKALFGPSIVPEAFVDSQRGKAFAVIHRGEFGFLLWDLVTIPRPGAPPRVLGGFVMYQPLDQRNLQSLLRICIANWKPQHGLVPSFIPLDPGTSASGILLHPSLRHSQMARGLHAFARRFRTAPGRLPDRPVAQVRLPFTRLNRPVALAEDDRSWALPIALPPIVGHLGVLAGALPLLAPSGSADAAWLATVLLVAGWLGILIRFALFGGLPDLRVRNSLFAWLVGVVAMPIVLSLGTTARYQSDLSSNLVNQLKQQMSDSLKQIEADSGAINGRYQEELRKIAATPELCNLMVQAKRDPAKIPALRQTLTDRFQRAGLPVNGFYLFGRDNFTIEQFAPHITGDVRKIFGDVFISLWRRFLTILVAQESGSASMPADIDATQKPGILAGLFPEIRLSNTSQVSDGIDIVQIGPRSVVIGKKVIPLDDGFGFFFVIWADPQALHREFLTQCVRSREEKGKPFFQAFTVEGDTPRPVSTIPEHRRARLLASVAREGFKQQTWRTDSGGGELLFARVSEHLPGFVLVAGSSLQPVTERLRLEDLRSLLMICGLTTLLVLVARRLETRLAKPVEQMAESLEAIADGNLAIRLDERRPDELGESARTVDTMTAWLEERRLTSRFVSPEVMDLIGAGDVRQTLAGSRRTAVLLVSDIRGFTTLAETHPPEAIFEALDRHLAAMTEAIQEQGGVIDRFIGDAIQAVFYPPPGSGPALSHAAQRALRASLQMLERHRTLQIARREAGEFTWEIGIGIDAGEILAGVMGDPDSRLDFSVLGDPLRRAADLESSSRHGTETRIVVSSGMRNLCRTWLPTRPLAGHPHAFEVMESITIGSVASALPPSPPAPAPDASQGPALVPSGPTKPVSDTPFHPIARPLIWALPLALLLISLQGFISTRIEHASARTAEHFRRGFALAGASSDKYLQSTIDLRRRVARVNRELIRRSTRPGSSAGQRLLHDSFTPLHNIVPGVRWFAFEHRYLPPREIQPQTPGQAEETGGRPYSHFPPKSIRLVASGGSPASHSFLTRDARAFFDLARQQLVDRVQEYPTIDSTRMISTSADWGYNRFPKLFGVSGKMSLARYLDHSIGRVSFTLIDGKRYLLFWDFFVHPDIPRRRIPMRMKSILGGVLVLFPLEEFTAAAHHRLLVGNAAALGLEAALASPEPGGMKLYATTGFHRTPALRAICLAPPSRDIQASGHLVAARPLTRDPACTLFLAVPEAFRFQGGLFGKISFSPVLAALLGALAVLLIRATRLIPEHVLSLRWQLGGAFLLVLFPALVHAGFSLDRSRLERLDRLTADARNLLEERLRSFDESSRLAAGQFCSFFDSRLEAASYAVSLASLAQSCTPPVGRSVSRDMSIPIGEIDHEPFRGFLSDGFRHGIALKQIGAVGPGRFAAGFDQKPMRLEIIHGVFAPTLQALVQHEETRSRSAGDSQRILLVGSEIDKAMNTFRSMLPPEGWAAMTAEPRHLQGFANPRSFEYQFFQRHVFLAGRPIGLMSLFWDGRSAVLHQLLNWQVTPSDDPIRNSDLTLSLPVSPGFRLVPPFFVWSWDAALRGEVVTTTRTNTPSELVIWHPPVWTTLNLLADAFQEPVFTTLEPAPARRLRAVLPGKVMNGMLLGGSLSWSDLLDPFLLTIRQERLLLLALILLAIGLADRTAHRFLEPLLALAHAARRIMAREFTVRLTIEGDDEFGRLAAGFNRMAAGVEEGRLLSRFVSESVRLAVSDRGGRGPSEPSRESRSVEAVILFIGLPAFAARLSTDPAPELVQDLNLYLREMAALVRRHGGEIDKFIGEKILAVFHPDRLGGLEAARVAALDAASAMPARLATLPPWRGSALGIGIVTGTVLSGILGTAKVRLEYTIIGDPVNLASRLCDMACKKELGIITEADTAAFIRERERGSVVSLGPVALKGKARQVEVFQLRIQ